LSIELCTLSLHGALPIWLLKLRAKYADSFDGTCVIDRCEKTAYAAYKCRRHYEMESGRSAFSRHYKLRAEEAGVEYVAFDRLSILIVMAGYAESVMIRLTGRWNTPTQ